MVDTLGCFVKSIAVRTMANGLTGQQTRVRRMRDFLKILVT